MKYPTWGNQNRDVKAKAILQTVKHFTSLDLKKTKWLDAGCGSGGIASTIAPSVESIVGIDPEAWNGWNDFMKIYPNLKFHHESFEKNSLPSNYFDVIICNQVYEHVQHPQALILEIYRMLKPGGHVYFAGPNWLFPVEPHVFWPFIHWLPRGFAMKLMKFLRSKKVLDADSTNYWQLKKWLKDFEITNALPYILKNPKLYNRDKLLWKVIAIFPAPLIHILTCFSPAFVFILFKR